MRLLNEFKMKNAFIIFLLIITLSGCLPEKKKIDSDAIRVVIADRVFKVPKGYLDGKPAYGKDTESLVLRYSLPSFEILPDRSKKEERNALINSSRMRGMLLENATSRPEFTSVTKSFLKDKRFVKQKELLHGLENYIYKVEAPISSDPRYAPWVRDDFLIERSKYGKVQSYLRCDPPGDSRFPSCNHRFIDKGIAYKIRWSTKELPHWREQRKAAIAFIDSMEYKEEK